MNVNETDSLQLKLTFGTLNLNILYIRFAPPNRISNILTHFHSSYELHFIPYGYGKLITTDKEYDITPNTFYLTGPGVYHAQIGNTSNPMAEYCINFEIVSKNPEKCNESKDMEILSEKIVETKFWYGQDEYNCIQLFKQIFWELNNACIGFMENINNYLKLILMNCARTYFTEKQSLESPLPKSKDDNRRMITDLYLQNYAKECSIRELSHKLQLSERQTSRFFLSTYGRSLQEQIKIMRLDAAKHLLQATDNTIQEVAEIVGYSDPFYFSRLFTRYTGIVPSQYKKQKNVSISDAIL